MGHVRLGWVAAAGLLAAVSIGRSANAADQGITGKKLLLKTGELVLLSKEAGISIVGSDPVGGTDSSVSFDNGNGPVSFSLPKTNWSTNGSATLFKYKNASAPGGPSVVKIAKVKAGLLKVVAKGLPFAVPNGAATIDVVLSLDGGTDTYCMSFTGTGDGNRFLVKDTSAGSCSPPVPTPTATATETPTATPPTCAGQLVGGFCWFSSAPFASCDETCAAVGKTCDAATITYAGSGGTTSNCGAVLDALFGSGGAVDADCTGFGAGLGCCAPGYGSAEAYGRCTAPPTTCAASHFAVPRACACQ